MSRELRSIPTIDYINLGNIGENIRTNMTNTVNSVVTTICTPTIVTAAIFLAILALDMARMEFGLLGGHLILGLISTLLVSVICQNTSSFVAWILIMVPFVILILSWMSLGVKRKMDEKLSPYRIPAPTPSPSSPVCCKKPSPCCVNPSNLPSA